MATNPIDQALQSTLTGEPVKKSGGISQDQIDQARRLSLGENPEEVQRLGAGTAGYNLRPDKFDFQMRTYADNNEIRANRFGALKSLGAGTGKLLSNTTADILGGASSLLIGIPSAIVNGDANQLFDNVVNESITEAQEWINEELFPIYNSVKDNNKNILQRALTDEEFWTNDILGEGVPFLLSAWLTGAATSAALRPLTKAKYLKSIEAAKGLGATATAPLAKNINTAEKFATAFTARTVEGLVEAKDTRDQVYNKLTAKGVSPEEASKEAATAAMATFGLNYALMPVEYLQAGSWFKSFAKSRDELLRMTKNGLELPKRYALNKVAKEVGMNIVSEGPVEENFQKAIQDYIYSSFTGNDRGEVLPWQKDFENGVTGIFSKMGDNFTTKEGWDAIGTGSILGGLFGGAATALSTRSKAEKQRIADVKANLDVFNSDRAKVDERVSNIVNNLKGFDKLDKYSKIQQAQNNEPGWNVMESLKFGEYAFANFEAGLGQRLQDQITDVEDLSEEEFLSGYKQKDKVDELRAKATRYEELYNMITNRFQISDNTEGRRVKQSLFREAILQEELEKEIAKIEPRVESLTAMTVGDTAVKRITAQRNRLKRKNKAIKATIEDIKNTEDPTWYKLFGHQLIKKLEQDIFDNSREIGRLGSERDQLAKTDPGVEEVQGIRQRRRPRIARDMLSVAEQDLLELSNALNTSLHRYDLLADPKTQRQVSGLLTAAEQSNQEVRDTINETESQAKKNELANEVSAKTGKTPEKILTNQPNVGDRVTGTITDAGGSKTVTGTVNANGTISDVDGTIYPSMDDAVVDIPLADQGFSEDLDQFGMSAEQMDSMIDQMFGGQATTPKPTKAEEQPKPEPVKVSPQDSDPLDTITENPDQEYSEESYLFEDRKKKTNPYTLAGKDIDYTRSGDNFIDQYDQNGNLIRGDQVDFYNYVNDPEVDLNGQVATLELVDKGTSTDNAHVRVVLSNGLSTSIHTTEFVKNNIAQITDVDVKAYSKWRADIVNRLTAGLPTNLTLTGKGTGVLLRNQKIGQKRARRRIAKLLDINKTPIGVTIKSKQGEEHVTRLYDWKGAVTPPVTEMHGFGRSGGVYVGVSAANNELTPIPVWSRTLDESEAKLIIAAIRKRFEGKAYEAIPGTTWTYNDLIKFYIYPSSSAKGFDVFISDQEKSIRIGASRYTGDQIYSAYPQDLVAGLMGKIHQVQNKRIINNENIPTFSLVNNQIVVGDYMRYRDYMFNSVLETDAQPIILQSGKQLFFGQPTIAYDAQSVFEDTKITPTESSQPQGNDAQSIQDILNEGDDIFNLPATKRLSSVPLSTPMNEYTSYNELEMLNVMKMLPQVPISVVKDIIHIQESFPSIYAVGTFHKGLISIYENAPSGTVYHEAFHAVFRMMLNKSERNAILKEQSQTRGKKADILKQKLNIPSAKISDKEKVHVGEIFKNSYSDHKFHLDELEREQYEEDVDVNLIVPTQGYIKGDYVSSGPQSYPHAIKYKGKYYLQDGHHRVAIQIQNGVGKVKLTVKYAKGPVDELALEEELAERFEQFMLADGNVSETPKVKNFFQRLWNMIKTFVMNLFGTVTVEDIYNRIKTGYYAHYDGDPNRFKSIAPKLYNLSPQDDVDLMNYITRQFFAKMFRDLEKFDITDTESIGVINGVVVDNYNSIKETLKKAANALPEGETKKKYNHIVERFDEIVKAHQIWMEKYKIYVPDTDINPEEENLKLKDSFQYAEPTEYSAKDNANFVVKLFISALPKKKIQGDTIVDSISELGLPEVTDYNETWNFLLDKLSGSTSIDQIIAKLQPYFDVKPEIKIIANLLSKPGNFTQELFKTQFLQNFSKFNTRPITTLFRWVGEGDNKKISATLVEADSQNFREIIRSQWISNFIASDLVEIDPASRVDDYISKNPMIEQIAGSALGEIDKSKNDISVIKRNLSKFGINFTDGAVEAWIKLNDKNKFISSSKYIISKFKDPNLKNKFELFTGFEEVSNLNQLAEIEGQFNPGIIEAVHLNPENKPTYHYIQNNFLSRTISDINGGDLSYINNVLNSYYGANSVWGANIKAGLRPEIKLIEGARLEGFKGKLTTKLTPGMWISTRINSILSDKPIFPILRPAEKKSEYGLQGFELVKSGVVRNNNGQGLTAIDINNSSLIDQFYGYFEDEYKRTIYAYLKERKRSNADIPLTLLQYLGLNSENDISSDSLAPFDTRGQKMTFFGPIILQSNPKLLAYLQNYHRPTVQEVMDVRLAIKQYLVKQINTTFDYLNDNSVVRVTDAKGNYKSSRTEAYKNLKETGTSLNISNLTIGEAQLKRYANDTFTAIADFAINEMVSSIEYIKLTMGDVAYYKDFFKRTPLVTGTGKLARVDAQIAKDIQPEYSKLRAKYPKTRSKEEIERGDINISVVVSPKKNSSQIELFEKQLKSLNLSDTEIKDIVDGYKGYDEADAFSWITPQAAREFLIRIGDWNPSLESVYNNISEGRPVSYKSLKNFLTAMKLMGAGPIDVNDPHVVPMAYLKTATLPILPHVVKGKELENLLTKMYESGTDMVIVDSGSKGASHNITPLYDATGRINLDSLSNAKFNFKYLKLQLDVQQQAKTKVVFGTQLRKLIFSHVFEYDKDKLVDKTFKVAGKSIKTNELWTKFNSLYADLTKKYKTRILTDLGINFDIASETYDVVDWAKLVDKLKTEAQGRFYPKSVIDSIRLNPEGNGLDIPGDALVNRKSIENLLNALIYNNVVSQKMSGTSSVQVPVTGFEEKGKIKSVTDSTGELKFISYEDGRVTEAEVYLPHNWRNKAGYLNNLDLSQVDDNMKVFIGFRIPTEGLRSIIKIKIKGFLPPEMGQVVVVPSELVAQSGSDFDIDKLNIIQPHGIWNEETKRIERITGDSIQGVENEIFDIVEGLLSHKDAFVPSLKTTGQTVEYLKTLALDIKGDKQDLTAKEEDPLSIIEFDKKMDIAYKFIAGKDGVGVAALHNTHHVLTQAANTKLSEEATSLIGFRANKDESGKATLSGKTDSNGKLQIADVLAASLNGFVDIVKNPFIVDLFTDLNTASTALTLIRLGAPIEWVVKFVNQPLIQRFIKNTDFAKSEIGRITKTSVRQVKEALRLEYYNKLDEKGKALVDLDTWTLNTPMFKNTTTEQLANYISIGYTNGQVNDAESDVANNDKGITPNEYYLAQISLLSDFLNYEMLAGKIRLLVVNSASDTFHAKTFNDVDRFVRRKEQIDIDETREGLAPYFDNYQDLSRINDTPTFVQSFYENGLKTEYNAFRRIFPIRQSEQVQNAVRRVESLVGKTNRLRDYEIEKISDSLMGYIMYKGFSKDEIKDFVLDQYETPESRLLVSSRMKFNLMRGKTRTFLKKSALYKVGQKLNLNDIYSVEITHVEKTTATKFIKSNEEIAAITGARFFKPNAQVFAYETRLIKNKIKKESTIRRIHKIKTGEETSFELKDNIFFKNLRVNFSRKANGVNSLRFRARPTDNVVHEDLVDQWREMFNSGDPDTRKLALDIAKYAIYQSGMKQTNISFFKYIPPEQFSTIVNESLNSFDESLDEPSILTTVFKNFWKDDTYVPTIIFDNQVTYVRNSKSDLLGYILKKNNTVNDRFYEISPPPFLKINNGAGGVNLMELVGFTGERQSGDAVYQITNKLGDGTLLSEYHSGESVYADNNEYLEETEELYKYVNSSVPYWTASETLTPPTIIEEAIAPKSDTYSQVEAESNDDHNIDVESLGMSDNDLEQFGSWFADEFGQLTPQDNRPPDDKLNKLLESKLADIGVSVNYLDRIYSKIGSPIAVAKVLTQSIEVAKGRADITTLPEEAAHMFVAMLDQSNPLMVKMMREIVDYPVYAEVVKDYSDAYNNDETKLKLEAIGKLIGNMLVGTVDERAKGWWSRVWEFIKKILSKVDPTGLTEYSSNSPSTFKSFAMDIVKKTPNKTLSEAIVINNYNSIILQLQEGKYLKKNCS